MSQLDADGAYGHRNRVTLAERIHARLDELGLSMNKLNERCGFGQGYVSRLAAGKRRSPRGETLEVLAAGLRVTMRWLVSGAGQKEDGIELPEHGLPPQADTAIRVAVARGASVEEAVAAAERAAPDAKAAERDGKPFDIDVWLARILGEEQAAAKVKHELDDTYESDRDAGRRGNLARVRAFLYERYPKLDVDLAIGSSEFIGAENIDELAACVALDRILSRQKFEVRHRKPALGERPLKPKPERRTSPSGSFSFDVPPPSTVPPAAEGKGRRR